MKKISIFILICSSLLGLIGCVEENFNESIPAKHGDDIVFGVRAGFEAASLTTKTVYGETYTIGDNVYQRINWLDKPEENAEGALYDIVQIYSPQAITTNPDGLFAHYDVVDTESQTNDNQYRDYASLVRRGDASLQWNGDAEHTFYAIYPSTELFTDSDEDKKMKSNTTIDENGVMYGYVSETQRPLTILEQQETNSEGDEITHYVAQPNMKYAYMAAKTTATRLGGNVQLSFVPVITALEIKFILPVLKDNPDEPTAGQKNVQISGVRISGSGIVGQFKANLGSWTEEGYPKCENIGSGDMLTIPTFRTVEGVSNPVVLKPGASLTLTVFLRPGADLNGLRISYTSGAGYVGKTLPNDVIIKAFKKNIITDGIVLPTENVSVNASDWLDQVEDGVQLKRLSLPGTGNTFSYNYTGENAQYYKQQTLTFEEQWKRGIRAFEIISDRPNQSPSSAANATSLGNEYVKCNKQSMSVTVRGVFDLLINKMEKSPREFAVVILTYQPEGTSPRRNALGYARSLIKLYNEIVSAEDGKYKEIFKLYTPSMTLADARGHIMVIVRPNQKDEPERELGAWSGGSIDQAKENFSNAISEINSAKVPFLIINGCGTAKDRWGSRGYKVNGNTAPDISNAYSGTAYPEYWMQGSSSSSSYLINPYPADLTSFTPSNPNSLQQHENVQHSGEMNFAYDTNNSNIICWYQDWYRIIDAPIEDYRYTNDYGNGYMSWFESKNEKIWNIIETYNMAISGDAEYENYVFINSLSGYYAGTEFNDSLTPSVGNVYGGGGGNFYECAQEMNDVLYQHIVNNNLDKGTGPTGIVLMDYVTQDISTSGSFMLPSVIMENNFWSQN